MASACVTAPACFTVKRGFRHLHVSLGSRRSGLRSVPRSLATKPSVRSSAIVVASAGLRTPKGFQKLLSVHIGTGIDQHGQDVTNAAIKAVQDAIGTSTLPGIINFVPGGLDGVKVKAKIGVPGPQQVDVEEVKKAFPYGNVDVKVVPGGLRWHSGIIMPELGDPAQEDEEVDSSDDEDQLAGQVFAKDEIIVASAAVRVGY